MVWCIFMFFFYLFYAFIFLIVSIRLYNPLLQCFEKDESMIQKDFIERQIDLIIEFISLLLSYKKNNQLDTIESAIMTYSKKNGLNLSILLMIDSDGLNDFAQNLDEIKKFSSAILLRELSENQYKQKKYAESERNIIKSLILFLAIEDYAIKEKSIAEVRQLIRSLDIKTIDTTLRERINKYIN